MGEPVKIVDLARDLIRLAGHSPGRRADRLHRPAGPGEKLFEELLADSDRTLPTTVPELRIAVLQHDAGSDRGHCWRSAPKPSRRGRATPTCAGPASQSVPEYRAAAERRGPTVERDDHFVNGKFTRAAHHRRAACGRAAGARARRAAATAGRAALGAAASAGRRSRRLGPGSRQRSIGHAGGPLHAWEQWSLPRAARAGLLLNLSGSAPYFIRTDRRDAPRCGGVRSSRGLFGRLRRVVPIPVSRAWGAPPNACSRSRRSSQARLAACLDVPMCRVFRCCRMRPTTSTPSYPDDRVLDRHVLRGRRYLLAVASANLTQEPRRRWIDAFAQLCAIPILLVVVGAEQRQGVRAGAVAADPPGVVRTRVARRCAAQGALRRTPLGLVFPSRYEGLRAAGARGDDSGLCQVAVSNAAALPEVCGDAALYFDPSSPSASPTPCAASSMTTLAGRLQHAGPRRAATGSRGAASAERLRAALDGARGAMKILQVCKFYLAGDGRNRDRWPGSSPKACIAGIECQVLCSNQESATVRELAPSAYEVLRVGSWGRVLSTSMAPTMPMHLRRLASTARHRPCAHARTPWPRWP